MGTTGSDVLVVAGMGSRANVTGVGFDESGDESTGATGSGGVVGGAGLPGAGSWTAAGVATASSAGAGVDERAFDGVHAPGGRSFANSPFACPTSARAVFFAADVGASLAMARATR